jgi:diguanylate cyclase (GGDEF)-like protein
MHQSRPGRPRSRTDLTIRQSILLGFVLMCAFTAAVGTYSSAVIRQSAALVVDTFDRSLMSIDYARAAGADFAAMQTGFLRQRLTTDPKRAADLLAQESDLADTFTEDLGISAERSQSPRARRAADRVRDAAAQWLRQAKAIPAGTPLADALARLDAPAEAVNHEIDILINLTAGDGFLYRQLALRSIRTETAVDIAATLAGLLLSAAVTWFLHRRIAGPVSAASAFAERIARGDLDVAIPQGRRDELGSLLISMATMRDSIRAMMQAEVSQRRSAQARLMDAIETTQEGVVLVDAAGQVVVTNAPVEKFFGPPDPNPQPSFGISDLLRNLARSRLSEQSLLSVGAMTWPLDRNTPGTMELALRDGTWLRTSWCATREGGLVAFFSDITLSRRREAELARTNLWFDAALAHMSQGMCVYDRDGLLTIVNTRFADIYHLNRGQIAPGMRFDSVQQILQALADPNPPPGEACPPLLEQVAAGKLFSCYQFLADGRVIAVSHRPISDGGFVLTYEDITARYRSDAKIAYLAGHDPLTALPNRTRFAERLDQALAGVSAGTCFALVMIDLDRFKEVNDTHGHPIGDQLLRVVAERLQTCSRQRDTVARLGGDEFAIIQADVRGVYDAQELAVRIIASIGRPFLIEGIRLEIGASIGIAMAPDHGDNHEDLLRNADTALYRVKAEGRSHYSVFSPSMDAALQDRRVLEHDLINARLDREMELHYQPIVDISAGASDLGAGSGGLAARISGFEALVRWHHPTRGLLTPGDFIGLSEDTGFIERLGAWILQRACADAARWPAAVKVAVNVSPIQFRSGRLVGRLRDALAETGIDAGRVELEITETTLLHNNEATLETLRQLHATGVKVVLDDFGTGFSSLSYLRSFPFDRIKIDRSFVKDLGIRDDATAIIRAILGLGRSLRVPVTAEGVETPAQLAQLRAEGCTEAQGYLFSRPVAVAKVERLLSQHGELFRFDDSPTEKPPRNFDGIVADLPSAYAKD